MFFKKFQNILNKVAILIIIINNTSCSTLTLQNISNKYDNIYQGNYLTTYDIEKIHIGMNKSEISQKIGLPTLKDIFGENVWYYIYYHQFHNKIIKQQNFMLKFNKNNILIELKNNSI